MALLPIDIQNKEFERSFRGYSPHEVDDFLEQLSIDYENVLKEKASLDNDIKVLKEQLEQYHKLESTLHNAIIVAQETAEEVKRNANKEAELIRKEAEKEAQRIIEEARYKASKIIAEHEELHKQAQVFKMRFRSFVEAQLASLEMEDWINLQEEEDEKSNSDQE